jgi:hypothetical protein
MLIAIAVIWLVGMVAICSLAWYELTRQPRDRGHG